MSSNPKLLLYTTLLAVGLSSCHSYRIFPKEARTYTPKGNRETAYVINPEMKKEYAILMQSRIYDLTSDTTAAIKIKLLLTQRSLDCGQRALISFLFVGQIPVLYADRYQYKYEELKNGSVQEKNVELGIAKQVWFWDMFAFKHKNFTTEAGKALAYSCRK